MLKPKNSEREFLSDLDRNFLRGWQSDSILYNFDLPCVFLMFRFYSVLCSPSYYPDVTYFGT